MYAFGVSPSAITIDNIHTSADIHRAFHLSNAKVPTEDMVVNVHISGNGKQALKTPLGTSVPWKTEKTTLSYPFSLDGSKLPAGSYEIIAAFSFEPARKQENGPTLNVIHAVGARIHFSITNEVIINKRAIEQVSIGAKSAGENVEMSFLGVNDSNIPFYATSLAVKLISPDGTTETIYYQPKDGITLSPFSETSIFPTFDHVVGSGKHTAQLTFLDDKQNALIDSDTVTFTVLTPLTLTERLAQHKKKFILLVVLALCGSLFHLYRFSQDSLKKK